MSNTQNPNKIFNNFQKEVKRKAELFAVRVPELNLMNEVRQKLIIESKEKRVTLQELLLLYEEMCITLLREYTNKSGIIYIATLDLNEVRHTMH